MKKFVLLLCVTVLFFGCSPGQDDNPKFHLEMLPVESAVFPTEFKKDQSYDILVKFVRPTTCHIFNGFYYNTSSNVRTIAIQSSVIERDNCIPTSGAPIGQILKFKPTNETSYVFKLWKGKGEAGIDIYEEITIPVIP
jgi:hypothetical protein